MTTSVLIDGHEFLISITSAPVLGGTTARPAGPSSAPGGPDSYRTAPHAPRSRGPQTAMGG